MSTMKTRPHRFHRITIVLASLLIASLALSVAAQETKKIRRFGNPVTSFSKEPADSLEKLQSQVASFRADIEEVLRRTNWDGDAQDFFNAVAAGEAERVSVPVGEKFRWMAFRKYKELQVTENVEWAGKQPFSAWRVKFESGDQIHTFIIPEVCLNIALYTQEPIPPNPPSCSLSASVASPSSTPCGELAKISLTGETNGVKMEITEVRGPGGNTSALSSAGTHRWTYEPTAAGRYAFTATATNARGETRTCTADATVPDEVACVECRLTASYDPASKTFTVDGSGSVGSVEITAINQPDGTGGDLSLLTADGEDRWTYSPKRRGRKAGDYTFAATATAEGETDDCTATATVPGRQRAEAGEWILRVFGAVVDTDESFSSASTRPDGSSQRDFLRIESGEGFGLGIERKFTPRLGLELSAIFADLDSRFQRDIDAAWETDEEDLDFVPITLGLNYHLTPNSKADLYIGPLVGVIQSDDVRYRVLGETVGGEVDDDFTFGAQIGIDVPAASKFAFHAGLRWLDASFDLGDDDAGEEEIELSLDPLTFMVGFAYRF